MGHSAVVRDGLQAAVREGGTLRSDEAEPDLARLAANGGLGSQANRPDLPASNQPIEGTTANTETGSRLPCSQKGLVRSHPKPP